MWEAVHIKQLRHRPGYPEWWFTLTEWQWAHSLDWITEGRLGWNSRGEKNGMFASTFFLIEGKLVYTITLVSDVKVIIQYLYTLKVVILIEFSRIKYGENRLDPLSSWKEPLSFLASLRQSRRWGFDKTMSLFPMYISLFQKELWCVFMLGSKKRLSWKITSPFGRAIGTWNTFLLNLHPIKLRTEFPEPGWALWFTWFSIKAIYIQRMCTHAASHKSNEIKRRNRKNPLMYPRSMYVERQKEIFLCLISV